MAPHVTLNSSGGLDTYPAVLSHLHHEHAIARGVDVGLSCSPAASSWPEAVLVQSCQICGASGVCARRDVTMWSSLVTTRLSAGAHPACSRCEVASSPSVGRPSAAPAAGPAVWLRHAC